MEACPLQFRVIYYLGPWYYESEKEALYHKIHRFVTISAHLYLYISVIIQLYFLRNNVDEFSNLMYLALDFSSFTVNFANFVFRRKKIIQLQKWCEEKSLSPENCSEVEILKGYNLKCVRIFQALSVLYSGTVVLSILSPLLSFEKVLPFNSFVFYKIDTPLKFWSTYALQSYTMMLDTILGTCLDSMAFSFMVLATGQFELLTHRITHCKLRENPKFIEHWSNHYQMIKEFTKLINDVFIPVIVANFSCSLFVLSSCIYVLSQV